MSLLEEFINNGIYAFLLIFVRIGTASMIMPGLGNSFVPEKIRLMMALGITLVLTPLIMPMIPEIPSTGVLLLLIAAEFITGLFIGTIARIFMTALDTAGMIISMQSGLANAQIFNPVMAGQGSIMGAFLSVTGVTLLFVSNFHHILIMGLVESYNQFPFGKFLDTGSLAELVTKAVTASFLVGVQISMPFIIIGLVIYIGMGILSRLMPQIQVFLIAIPIQILISLTIMALITSAGLMFWLSKFHSGMIFVLGGG